MAPEQAPNVPAVIRFVREVVGCDCPDEVFRQIQVRHGSAAVQSCSADYELRIGGRLLIVVTSEPVAALSGARLEKVISEGKRARDDAKFNRFRLLVQAKDVALGEEMLQRAFQDVSAKDEKTHVQAVETKDVPDFFQEQRASLPAPRG